jgi:hypothetical protein
MCFAGPGTRPATAGDRANAAAGDGSIGNPAQEASNERPFKTRHPGREAGPQSQWVFGKARALPSKTAGPSKVTLSS